ncbi:MAG: peptidylprolyl isomerase [Sandaracinaceae bacterium]|nr:peptidylprolyl isomerase [Sandaracinaceae bacterium]
MWENFGKKVQTFLLIFIVVLLSLVMGVIGFGNPTGEGCNADGPGYAAQVYGETISEGEFRAAYTVTGFTRYPAERAQTLRLKEYTLDGLIERELLVREADRLGLTADPDEVMREIAREEVVRLGGPIGAPDGYPAGELQQSFRDRDGTFSADYFERFVQNYLRRSIDEFLQWQVAETRANMVRDLVSASVTISNGEVWDAYVQENDRAQLSYVRFDPAHYTDRVEVTDAAVGAWMTANAEALDQEYRRQRHRYTNLEEQTHARHILLQIGEDASDTDRAAKRAEAEGLLAQLQGGADFGALAREHSNDEGSAARGGDLGWFPRGRMVAPFEEAAFGADPNTLIDHLVESRFGFHIIEVLGRRSGDVPEDEAKRELADGMFREARASELAHEDADRALAYLRDGHTPEELDDRLAHDWAEPAAEEPPAEGEPAEGEPAEEPPPERDSRAPQVRETLNFGRAERAVPGPFDSGPLTQAAFEMTMDEPLPEAPLQLGESWFVFQLISRTTANEEDFDEANRERLRSRLLTQKQHETLSAYIGRLRRHADAEGQVVINQAILSYGLEPDAGVPAEGASEETAAR